MNIIIEIIEFVDNSSVKNKEFYLDLIMAQLSPSEYAILFLYGLKDNQEELKSFIERYTLLKKMPDNPISGKYRWMYNNNAYGSQSSEGEINA